MDGDLVNVVKNKIISDSCDMEQAIVLDTSDKATALKEEITKENIVNAILRSMISLIGELSNLSTRVLNRLPRNDEEKKKQKDYVDLLSIIVGKSIDAAKCGVLWLPPKIIAKTYRLVPYFMKYISPYYAKMKKFSYSRSNMNELAFDIDVFEKSLRKKLNSTKETNFDYSIMLDNSIPWNSNTALQIQNLYKQFQIELKELKRQQTMSYKSPEYYNYFGESKQKDVLNTSVDWNEFFNSYKKRAKDICPNEKELANYTVRLCYENDTNDKNFVWIISEEGILLNIQPIEHELPVYDPNGKYEYLGKRYSLAPYKYTEGDLQEEITEDLTVNDEENYIDEEETNEEMESLLL